MDNVVLISVLGRILRKILRIQSYAAWRLLLMISSCYEMMERSGIICAVSSIYVVRA